MDSDNALIERVTAMRSQYNLSLEVTNELASFVTLQISGGKIFFWLHPISQAHYVLKLFKIVTGRDKYGAAGG